MALRIPNPKKSPAWAKRALGGSQAVCAGPGATAAPDRGTSSPVSPKTPRSASPRPGSLAWAVERGWQLGTNYETGVPLVYAWKASGERTPLLPAGPIPTEATWYGPALRAAVEMEASR